MPTLQELMGQEIYDLLYTHYNQNGQIIEDMEDVFYCEDEDIPQQRITKLEKLLVPISKADDTLIPLAAAKLLSAWGSEKAVDYFEYCIDQRIHRFGNLEPHRLHPYDTTYENFINNLLNYHARCADFSEGKGDKARQRIFPIMEKIIALSKEVIIDIGYNVGIFQREGWKEYLPVLKECYLDFIQRPENDLNRQWNLPALTELLEEWDPEFLTNC